MALLKRTPIPYGALRSRHPPSTTKIGCKPYVDDDVEKVTARLP